MCYNGSKYTDPCQSWNWPWSSPVNLSPCTEACVQAAWCNGKAGDAGAGHFSLGLPLLSSQGQHISNHVPLEHFVTCPSSPSLFSHDLRRFLSCSEGVGRITQCRGTSRATETCKYCLSPSSSKQLCSSGFTQMILYIKALVKKS